MKIMEPLPIKTHTAPKTYRMCAEWEPHEATWLAWPHNAETWPNISKIEDLYAEMISEVLRGEKIRLLVNGAPEEDRVRVKLSKKKIDFSKITFLRISTTDAWIRDYGPNFVLSSGTSKTKIAVNHWIFNAWGAKYEEHQLDNKASKKIVDWLKIMTFEPGIVLEGGSIDVNGKGTVLTTEECLLNPNRNPGFDKTKVEAYLKTYLGVGRTVWLGEGIKGDDTDGHIDDIARFVNPNTVVCAVESNPKHTNFKVLSENKKRLQNATDQDGKKLTVIDLPMPKPLYASRKPLPASYANFYISNSAVLVPIFKDPNDKEVLKVFRSLFPGRSVIGIRSEILVHGLGGIHCVTHEEPAIV